SARLVRGVLAVVSQIEGDDREGPDEITHSRQRLVLLPALRALTRPQDVLPQRFDVVPNCLPRVELLRPRGSVHSAQAGAIERREGVDEVRSAVHGCGVAGSDDPDRGGLRALLAL